MARKRSRFEMHMDVLRAIRSVHKPTRIMYKTNLSWIPLKDCLRKLTKAGLITEKKERGRKYYYVTEKGKNALNYIEQLMRDMKEILPMEELRL